MASTKLNGKRRRHTAAMKAKVALAAVENRETTSQLATRYQVHPAQVSQWKAQLLSRAEELFADGRAGPASDHAAVEAELYQQIGKLQMELAWLKKKAAPFA
jgi:putative transposase